VQIALFESQHHALATGDKLLGAAKWAGCVQSAHGCTVGSKTCGHRGLPHNQCSARRKYCLGSSKNENRRLVRGTKPAAEIHALPINSQYSTGVLSETVWLAIIWHSMTVQEPTTKRPKRRNSQRKKKAAVPWTSKEAPRAGKAANRPTPA